MTRCTFKDNVGGGTYIGADVNAYASEMTISKTRFSGSTGGTGDGSDGGSLGAIGAKGLRVIDSTFENVYTSGDGGAVAVHSASTAEFVRCYLVECIAGGYGTWRVVTQDSL